MLLGILSPVFPKWIIVSDAKPLLLQIAARASVLATNPHTLSSPLPTPANPHPHSSTPQSTPRRPSLPTPWPRQLELVGAPRPLRQLFPNGGQVSGRPVERHLILQDCHARHPPGQRLGKPRAIPVTMPSKPAGRGGRPSCSRMALTGEGGLAGRHFVDHGAQREEVGACIDGLAACSGNMQATVPRVDPGEVRSPLGAPNVLRRMLPGWRTWPWLRRRPPAWPNRNRGF